MDNFCLEVSGDYACFTRPEMKVERVSYDVITPSAARSIFEAILWKPAIRWEVKRIVPAKVILRCISKRSASNGPACCCGMSPIDCTLTWCQLATMR